MNKKLKEKLQTPSNFWTSGLSFIIWHFMETASQTFTCLLTVGDFPRFLHSIAGLILPYHWVSKSFHFPDYADLFHFFPFLRRSWPNCYLSYNTFVYCRSGSFINAFIGPLSILKAWFLHFPLFESVHFPYL